MNIIEWAVRLTETLGGPGVALLLFLENVFPPIPSEVILPLAGVSAGMGTHPYWAMLLWATAGGLLGAYLLYGLGYAFGADRVRRLCEFLPLLETADFDKSVDWFERHGTSGIFFGRMIPGVRSLISIPAGVYRMPLPKFTLLTLAGSGIWNAIFVTIGYFLGESWHLIEPYTDLFSYLVYAIIVGLVVWFVAARVMRNRRASRTSDRA